MSRLIIVSNRVPSADTAVEPGGLAVALGLALREKGGIWLGWSGAQQENPEVHERIDGQVRYCTIDLAPVDYNGFYAGFCNSVLWPLCHYRLDLVQFEPEMYKAYDRVNARFADELAALVREDDVIWAQDYHLFLLASHLRTRGVTQKMGFFHHIPFPGPEIIAALPHHTDLLRGLAAYDVVGFQTDNDLQSFLRCLKLFARDAQIEKTANNIYEVRAFGRRFKAGDFPISIDTQDLMDVAERSLADPQMQKLRENLESKNMIIGVDRLDYTKGLVERVTAYQNFLLRWPEHRGNVSYVQITPTSRTDIDDYDKIRIQLEGLAAHVNGVNAEIDWTPIRYINRSFSRTELAGFYRASRVALVTPLRDGMNLVAKEYVASQDPENPGVLILSRFAGAAVELAEGAILINPHNAHETADWIHHALAMPLEERKQRYQAMIAVLKRNDIFAWTKNFLSSFKEEANRRRTFRFAPAKILANKRILGHIRGTAGFVRGTSEIVKPQIESLIKNLSLVNE